MRKDYIITEVTECPMRAKIERIISLVVLCRRTPL